MVPNSLIVSAALTAAGIVLVLANWYTKPEAAPAWAAALAMFVIMIAALRRWRPIVRPATTGVVAVRGADQITTAVGFAALIMGIPLALTLARSYGLVDGTDIARRSTGVLIGAFLAMLGNVMPKHVPPLSSIGCEGARQQAFYRRAGWTWVLCGLISAIGWLALPLDSAEIATTALVVTAMALTILHLVRLAGRARTSPPMH